MISNASFTGVVSILVVLDTVRLIGTIPVFSLAERLGEHCERAPLVTRYLFGKGEHDQGKTQDTRMMRGDILQCPVSACYGTRGIGVVDPGTYCR